MLQTLAWLLGDEFGREKLALAGVCSVMLYVLAGHLGRRLCPGGVKGWLGRLLVQTGRLCYYVGLPAVAVWRGELYSEVGIPTTLAGSWQGSPRRYLIALTRSTSLAGIGQGITLAVGLLVLLLGIWIWYVRVSRGPGSASEPKPAHPVAWWDAAREAVYAQLLWAFYRGIAAQWTGERSYAAFAGLAIVGISWLLNPWRRERLGEPWGASLIVSDWVLAVGTALITLSVRSLVLLIPLHTVLAWASNRVLHHVLDARRRDVLVAPQ